MEPHTYHHFVELYCQAIEIGDRETIDMIESILQSHPQVSTPQSEPIALNVDCTFANPEFHSTHTNPLFLLSNFPQK